MSSNFDNHFCLITASRSRFRSSSFSSSSSSSMLLCRKSSETNLVQQNICLTISSTDSRRKRTYSSIADNDECHNNNANYYYYCGGKKSKNKMEKILLTFCCWWFSLFLLFLASTMFAGVRGLRSASRHFHIGAVLNSQEDVLHFEKTIADINFENGATGDGVDHHHHHQHDVHNNGAITLIGHTILKRNNALEDLHNFCQNLMSNKISAVIIDDREPSEAITFTASLHQIPTIGLTNRECIFSDKSLFGSYMRTASPWSHQADVWVELLTHLEFECAHFIVSNSINGRQVRTRFIELADATNGFDIETTIEYNYRDPVPSLDAHLRSIKEMNSSCRVFVLHTDQENSREALRTIAELNMTGPDFVWLVGEQALAESNLPVGFLGARYHDGAKRVHDHIYDAVSVIAEAFESMTMITSATSTTISDEDEDEYADDYDDDDDDDDRRKKSINDEMTTPPADCRNIGAAGRWRDGPRLYNRLRRQAVVMAKTGKIAFDERGDRLNANYDIMNQQYDRRLISASSSATTTALVSVGERRFDSATMRLRIELRQNEIVWPGNRRQKPVGYMMLTHLKIATIVEPPFVRVLPADRRGECPKPNIGKKIFKIPCPIRKRDATSGEMIDEPHCCEGYCIDLLWELASQMNFTFELYQVQDGLYGGYSYDDESGQQTWTGLLGELFYGRADMVVAALTITPERSMVIDFTKPFKYQGITILQKRQTVHRTRHPLTSFLQPFQDNLWLSVFVAVHVMALTLYLLDRFSPFSRYKLPTNDSITEEDALNLSSAIWYAWGVLFNSGIGEGTPRSFSGRVLGMVWAGFAMIVVASYTANLAAFLVLDRPETALTGINDARLRNLHLKEEFFNYSTVRDSSVELYFRRQIELAPIYHRMAETGFFDNAEEAIAAVKSGYLKAFIWDSSRLEYETSKDSELSMSGEHFGRSGYAIGLRKGQNTYWKDRVTSALLGMHEIGFMEELDNKWILLRKEINETRETKTENTPPTLRLKNMAGVFILLGTGIVVGVGLIAFEIFYKRHQTRKQKRLDLARNAFTKWKEMVENRKLQLEALNLTARARFKERHQVHRRRQQLRNSRGGANNTTSSKSLSDDNKSSFSFSSSDLERPHPIVQFAPDIEMAAGPSGPFHRSGSSTSPDSSTCRAKQMETNFAGGGGGRSGSAATARKPAFLALKQLNSSGKKKNDKKCPSLQQTTTTTTTLGSTIDSEHGNIVAGPSTSSFTSLPPHHQHHHHHHRQLSFHPHPRHPPLHSSSSSSSLPPHHHQHQHQQQYASTFEQHPLAGARIHQHHPHNRRQLPPYVSKPKLRREYSIASEYDPSNMAAIEDDEWQIPPPPPPPPPPSQPDDYHRQRQEGEEEEEEEEEEARRYNFGKFNDDYYYPM